MSLLSHSTDGQRCQTKVFILSCFLDLIDYGQLILTKTGSTMYSLEIARLKTPDSQSTSLFDCFLFYRLAPATLTQLSKKGQFERPINLTNRASLGEGNDVLSAIKILGMCRILPFDDCPHSGRSIDVRGVSKLKSSRRLLKQPCHYT